MKTIERYKLDKHSLAVKLMKKNGFFEESLKRDIDLVDFAGDAKKMGVPLSDYVKEFCKDTTSDERDRRLAETAAYGMINLKEWCKYQQTYSLTDLIIKDFADKMPAEFDGDSLLPFPTIFVALEFKEEKKTLSFFIRQRGNSDLDVVAFSAAMLTYFPLNDEAFDQINERRFGGYFEDEASMVLAAYAFFIAVFLSVYRQKHTIAKVNRVVRRGGPRTNQASEWRFEDSVVMENLPDTETSLRAAFDLDGLIPPSEREEEVVEIEGTHASPRRHHVRTHTCIYWTGPGRKIPVVKTIQSYERGGKKGEKANGTKRICKPEK